jgi:O-methyltransferase
MVGRVETGFAPRDAYLRLLKLALCDLLGPAPLSAGGTGGRRTRMRVLTEKERTLREEGRDWPVNGVTMVGLRRLDHLHHAVERVLADGVPGDLIEAGVWRGGAGILMRAVLAVHGVTDRTVWLADSFQGLPRPRSRRFPADRGDRQHRQSFLAASQEEVQTNFTRYGLLDDRVRLVAGWFADTLPTLRGRRWALIRLDGDMYESTLIALESLYPGLAPGGYLIVDDYGALDSCRAAVEDFRSAQSIEERLEPVDWTAVSWRRGA